MSKPTLVDRLRAQAESIEVGDIVEYYEDDHCPGTARLLREAADAIERAGAARTAAIEVIARLARDGCRDTSGLHDDPCCYYCREDWPSVDEERHAPDCPYTAARSFLEATP